MGTSQSKPPIRGGSPLVPTWADQDPTPPSTPEDQSAEPDPSPDAVPDKEESEPLPKSAAPQAPAPTIPARHTAAFRTSLRDYMHSGDRVAGQRALGHFARGAGGARGGTGRYARASRSAGGVLAGMARASQGQAPAEGALDLRVLAGRPVSDAIDAIVDAFCPSGILDEDIARAAIAEGLAEALDGVDIFDPNALDDYSILLTARVFVAELVFATLAAEQGQSADSVSASQAVAREEGLRSLVREVTDLVGTPLLQKSGVSMESATMDRVVKAVIAAVNQEMAKW
jgi:hypothetical protein